MIKKTMIFIAVLLCLIGTAIIVYSIISSDGIYYVWGTMVTCVALLIYSLIVLECVNDSLEEIEKKIDLMLKFKIGEHWNDIFKKESK